MNYKLRQMEGRLRKLAANFKVVLVTGARQVGKTTLLSHVFPDLKVITFDGVRDIYDVRRDPDLFLNNFPAPLILDEVQFVPELLSAIKRRVDLSETRGQYFLSGSQNLSLLKGVTESLAGRVGILQLGPFTPLELAGLGHEQPWLERYLEQPGDLSHVAKGLLPLEDSLVSYLWRGFMPGTLTISDELIPEFYRSYLETCVERDIRRQGEIREIVEFSRFLGLVGALTAQEINTTKLGREIGIAPQTARSWLNTLYACYHWQELAPYHGNTIKRVAGKRKGFLSDSGLACWLQRISSPDALAASPLLGAIFESFVLSSLHSQVFAAAFAPQTWHWRTSGGAEVDLVLEKDGHLYPIEIKCKSQISRHDARGIESFRETYPDRSMPGIVVYAGTEAYRVTDNVIAIPWRCR